MPSNQWTLKAGICVKHKLFWMNANNILFLNHNVIYLIVQKNIQKTNKIQFEANQINLDLQLQNQTKK